MKDMILPRALAIAARAFKDRPKVVGEVLVALVTGDSGKNLSEVQKYILGDCIEDIEDRMAKREAERVRKRENRAKGRK